MSAEQRQCARYDKKLKVDFDFSYDAATKLKYRVQEDVHVKRYAGMSRNIGASGLCLTSHHKLEKGQHLHLEVFLPKGRQPIHMDGEVRWCDKSLNKRKKDLFEVGIKLKAVEGKSVDETVHLDEVHHVVWSNVLEAVFGTFRKLAQENK